jgi:hypothetical protein
LYFVRDFDFSLRQLLTLFKTTNNSLTHICKIRNGVLGLENSGLRPIFKLKSLIKYKFITPSIKNHFSCSYLIVFLSAMNHKISNKTSITLCAVCRCNQFNAQLDKRNFKFATQLTLTAGNNHWVQCKVNEKYQKPKSKTLSRCFGY